MAWSQADLDTLKQAIAIGAKSVRFADGRETEYRSLAEMLRTVDLITAELAGPAAIAEASPRVTYAEYDRG